MKLDAFEAEAVELDILDIELDTALAFPTGVLRLVVLSAADVETEDEFSRARAARVVLLSVSFLEQFKKRALIKIV